MLSPIYWKGYPIVSNLFVGYSDQSGDFDNGEYLGGDNYVLGLKNTYEHKGFKASFSPMIGVNNLGVKDYDTDKVEVKTTDFMSEFAALNGKINKKIGKDKKSINYTYNVRAKSTGITNLLQDLKDANLKLQDLKTEQTTLEKIFVSLVKENNEV